MGDYSRPTGIPRLQPTNLPGKPPANEVSQRFTTDRAAAVVPRLQGGAKPSPSGDTGPGQRFLSTRQPAIGHGSMGSGYDSDGDYD